ncbi:hypothetical protein E2C01_015420 [Portunus trituberculatus]|uniref:Uncharacterized protein n=1 Tax=Portunus trituberculatus TaxID=210409 RepID=A0A5B7DN53_PORTR|nr:hypothetical protein [Portunus trituberculatus]
MAVVRGMGEALIWGWVGGWRQMSHVWRVRWMEAKGKLWRHPKAASAVTEMIKKDNKEEEVKPPMRRHALLLATLSSPALTNTTYRNL